MGKLQLIKDGLVGLLDNKDNRLKRLAAEDVIPAHEIAPTVVSAFLKIGDRPFYERKVRVSTTVGEAVEGLIRHKGLRSKTGTPIAIS